MEKYVVHDLGVCTNCGERCGACEDCNTRYELIRRAKLRIGAALPKGHRPVLHKCDNCNYASIGVFGGGTRFRCLDCWVQVFTHKTNWLWCVYCGGTCKDNPEVSGTCVCNSCGKKSLQHPRISYTGTTMDAKLCECCGSAWCEDAEFRPCNECDALTGACCLSDNVCAKCREEEED